MNVLWYLWREGKKHMSVSDTGRAHLSVQVKELLRRHVDEGLVMTLRVEVEAVENAVAGVTPTWKGF